MSATVTCLVILAMAAAAPDATAATGSLTLSAAPTGSTQNRDLSATITASGVAGSDTTAYGGNDELDIFAAPAGSTCAESAEAEDLQLGLPSLDSSAYPGLAFVSGSFSQAIAFDSGSAISASYVLCGYLSYEDEFGATEAQASATLTLTAQPTSTTTTSTSTVRSTPPPTSKPVRKRKPAPKPTGSVRLRLSTHSASRGGRLTIHMTGRLNRTARPATLRVYATGGGCSGPGGRGYKSAYRLSAPGSYTRTFSFKFAPRLRAGTYHVCSYVTADQTARVLAKASALVVYHGLPAPPPVKLPVVKIVPSLSPADPFVDETVVVQWTSPVALNKRETYEADLQTSFESIFCYSSQDIYGMGHPAAGQVVRWTFSANQMANLLWCAGPATITIYIDANGGAEDDQVGVLGFRFYQQP